MKKNIIYSIGLLLATQTLSAQGRLSDMQQLKEVRIEAQKKNEKQLAEFKRHGQSVEVLSEEDLNRNNASFIEQSLNTVAGVQVDKRTQLGGQRIVIRGYGNDQKFNNWGIKAYYNAFPITTADGVTVLDDVDFGIVHHVEIIKGPAATMYGSGVGGVARFYLQNETEKGVTLQQKWIGGSFGLFQSNSRLDLVGDKASVSLHYGHMNSDGYRPHGSSDKNYFTLFSEIQADEHHKLTVYASRNHSVERISGQISYADYYAGLDPGNAAYIKKDALNDFTSTRFSLSNFSTLGRGLSNNTTLFYANSDYTNVSAGASGNSVNGNYGIRSVFTYRENIAKKLANDLSLGMELQQSDALGSSYRFTGTNDTIPLQVTDISKASYNRTRNQATAFFIQNRWTYTPYDLSLLVGLSSNKNSYARTDLLAHPGLISNYNKNVSYAASYEPSFNPHIALQKTYLSHTFNLSYSQGYNAPTSATTFISTLNKANDSLLPERARMIDLSVQGSFHTSAFDYQVSLFSMRIKDKLTQLNGKDPISGSAYAYWSNTGAQHHTGIEASLSYTWVGKKANFFRSIQPFVTSSFYQFSYDHFATKTGSAIVDYSGKQVVGVPQNKYTLGLDIKTKLGVYWLNTFHYVGGVYTDFANTNFVPAYHQLHAKVGYTERFFHNQLLMDIFIAGNNLTHQLNYTFLFLGNAINDSDPGNGYPPNVTTDVNPGPSKAYYFGGVSFKYVLGQ